MMDEIVQVHNYIRSVYYIVHITQISMNVMTTMVAVVRYATTLKEVMNAYVEMAMDIIVQVHIFYHGSYLMYFVMIKIQSTSLNVLTALVAVVRYATTLKEASNVYVMMAMN